MKLYNFFLKSNGSSKNLIKKERLKSRKGTRQNQQEQEGNWKEPIGTGGDLGRTNRNKREVGDGDGVNMKYMYGTGTSMKTK